MKRRTVLTLLGRTAAVLPLLRPVGQFQRLYASETTARLFYAQDDLPRIRTNSRTPLLKSYFEECIQADLAADRQFLRQADNTRDLLRDLRQLQVLLKRESLVYLITSDERRKDILIRALETVLQLPKWDYFLNGKQETIGLQRAPETVIAMLFAKEVLGDGLAHESQEKILADVAEKGCMPCYRSLWGMKHPAESTGWHFDPNYVSNYSVSMRRWPIILDRTNLKAIPISGLGLGALASLGRDKRAEVWLEMAEASAKTFLGIFGSDGSYEENISYADYSLRNLFLFFEAHQRVRGDIDWFDMANFYGVSEFLVCMQMGRQLGADLPDIANFGDAKHSFHPATAFWIAKRGGNPLAQYVGENFSARNDFMDYLWYHPERASEPPQRSLENRRFPDLDWLVCRTGWGAADTMLAFRSGRPANHEHPDRNSFILKAHGERLLTDHFDAAYDWRDPAWLLRQTEAHNAVLIDGKAHQYHDGKEGTNASRAEARIIRVVDHGDVVWWVSDATQAYQLANSDVDLVTRSVLFIKPDLVILHDQVRKKSLASRVSVRFHPDNRDGRAEIEIGDTGGDFLIRRPNALLYGRSSANVAIRLEQGVLAVPNDRGVFPYLEVATERARRVQLVTVLSIQAKIGREKPRISTRNHGLNWEVQVGNREISILVSGRIPEFGWAE